jgi:hypothetical protein
MFIDWNMVLTGLYFGLGFTVAQVVVNGLLRLLPR